MKFHLVAIAVLALCCNATAQTPGKLAASSGTDTTPAPVQVLAPAAIDPAAGQQSAVQPRLAAQGQDTPAKKEEDSNDSAPGEPKREE